MKFRDIALSDFRNHADSRLEFGEGINALFGDNGQGKTNVLEGLAYLSLTKSFYAASDGHAVRFGAAGFRLQGTLCDGAQREHCVRVAYTGETGEKSVTVNGLRPERLASVIGRFPVVILSPEHGPITAGGPSERRKFVDLVLSQISRVYLEDVLEYRKVLRQRNNILLESRRSGAVSAGALEPWTLSLARYGSRIVERRWVFVEEFRAYVRRAYADVVGALEIPDVRYTDTSGIVGGGNAVAIEAALLDRLQFMGEAERRRGVTLVGPHRDDIELTINGRRAQEYASQGQHKTFLVALKVAEFFYLLERHSEAPVVLLDDLFSELDRQRATRILGLVGSLGQSIITATDGAVFHGGVAWDSRHRRFRVDQGACARA